VTYNFKMYMSDEKLDEDIELNAIIFSENNEYEIIENIDDSVKELFGNIILGKFTYSLFKADNTVSTHKIDKGDILKNLKEFNKIAETVLGMYVSLDRQIKLNNLFSLRLKGDSYRVTNMLESKKKLAYEHTHSLTNNLVHQRNNDIFINEKTGSLKLEVTSPHKYSTDMLEQVVKDIEDSVLNKKFGKTNESYLNLYSTFAKINGMKNLDNFYIAIGENNEIEIRNRKFLKRIASKIYEESVIITGFYKSYDKYSNDKILKIESYKNIFSCHLSNLEDELIYDIEQKIQLSSIRLKFKISGLKTSQRTIVVEKIETV